MSTLFPYDLLFRDFFKSELDFQPAMQAKLTHPVDIFENKHGLHFDIACTGLTKNDIEINIEGDILRISYTKPQNVERIYSVDLDKVSTLKRERHPILLHVSKR